VLDSGLEIPLKAKVLNREASTIVVCTPKGLKKAGKIKKLIVGKNATVLVCKGKKGLVDLKCLLKELGKLGIQSLLVEGGATVADSFLEEKLVDKVMLFVAPFFVGEGKDFLSASGKKLRMKDVKIEKVGKDWLVEGYL